MQQETPSRRKPYANVLPLLAGALLAGLGLVACDRSEVAVSAREPAARTASLPAAPPAGAVPQAAPQPEAPSAPLPPREALTDTAITGKIKAAILTDPGMAGADVSVNTDRGVVMLAGVVKNPEQTAIASAHAQRQDGVMRVDNHLAVPPT